jgi:hypothetical protein
MLNMKGCDYRQKKRLNAFTAPNRSVTFGSGKRTRMLAWFLLGKELRLLAGGAGGHLPAALANPPSLASKPSRYTNWRQYWIYQLLFIYELGGVLILLKNGGEEMQTVVPLLAAGKAHWVHFGHSNWLFLSNKLLSFEIGTFCVECN